MDILDIILAVITGVSNIVAFIMQPRFSSCVCILWMTSFVSDVLKRFFFQGIVRVVLVGAVLWFLPILGWTMVAINTFGALLYFFKYREKDQEVLDLLTKDI